MGKIQEKENAEPNSLFSVFPRSPLVGRILRLRPALTRTDALLSVPAAMCARLVPMSTAVGVDDPFLIPAKVWGRKKGRSPAIHWSESRTFLPLRIRLLQPDRWLLPHTIVLRPTSRQSQRGSFVGSSAGSDLGSRAAGVHPFRGETSPIKLPCPYPPCPCKIQTPHVLSQSPKSVNSPTRREDRTSSGRTGHNFLRGGHQSSRPSVPVKKK